MSRIEDEVCKKIQQRAAVGKEKYGVTMERGDLDLLAWLQHLQEELMDATVYVQRLMEEVIEMEEPVEEKTFPVKEAYEHLTTDASPVPLHEVVSRIIETQKIPYGEALELLEREKRNYFFTFKEGISMIRLTSHPNIEENYSQDEHNTHPKRCEAVTKHGTRCQTLVHHERHQYNHLHMPCKKEKMLCWQHCDCGGVHHSEVSQ